MYKCECLDHISKRFQKYVKLLKSYDKRSSNLSKGVFLVNFVFNHDVSYNKKANIRKYVTNNQR